MDRVVEPELMETAEQARAYAEADFEAPHSRLVELFRERFPKAPSAAHAIEFGCGPGDIVMRFAAAFPGWRVDGVDGSAAMLAAAEICRQRYPEPGHRIRLVEGLLPDCALPESRYDILISNSLLHHLHDPSVLWRSVLKWAAPGALVFIADLRRPPSEAEAQRLTELHTRGEPDVLRHDFYHSLLAAFEPDEVRDQLRDAGLGHLAVDVVSDRHLLVWGTQ